MGNSVEDCSMNTQATILLYNTCTIGIVYWIIELDSFDQFDDVIKINIIWINRVHKVFVIMRQVYIYWLIDKDIYMNDIESITRISWF